MAQRLRYCVALVLLTACGRGAPAPAPLGSACTHQRFEDAGFIVCTVPKGARLRLFAAAKGEIAKRHFRDLGLRDDKVVFAMNAGMFDGDGRPIGLAIVDGREVHDISLRAGGGNFGMKPNGVLVVSTDGKASIVTSESYRDSAATALATQSGPMLVIDGKLHPRFKRDGESRNMRNAVGIGPSGGPLFVMTEDPVSFGKLARFFRDSLHSNNALYFDGSVSSLWSPADGRMDDVTELGPIIVSEK